MGFLQKRQFIDFRPGCRTPDQFTPRSLAAHQTISEPAQSANTAPAHPARSLQPRFAALEGFTTTASRAHSDFDYSLLDGFATEASATPLQTPPDPHHVPVRRTASSRVVVSTAPSKVSQSSSASAPRPKSRIILDPQMRPRPQVSTLSGPSVSQPSSVSNRSQQAPRSLQHFRPDISAPSQSNHSHTSANRIISPVSSGPANPKPIPSFQPLESQTSSTSSLDDFTAEPKSLSEMKGFDKLRQHPLAKTLFEKFTSQGVASTGVSSASLVSDKPINSPVHSRVSRSAPQLMQTQPQASTRSKSATMQTRAVTTPASIDTSLAPPITRNYNIVNTDKINKRPLSQDIPRGTKVDSAHHCQIAKASAASAPQTPAYIARSKKPRPDSSTIITILISVVVAIIMGSIIGAIIFFLLLQ